MTTATDFLEVIGLLALLVSVAVIFATLVRWVAGKRRSRVRMGFELLVMFSLVSIFIDPIVGILSLAEFRSEAARGASTFWWLSLAYLIDAMTGKFVWRGVLARDGEASVPKILTGFVAALIYLVAVMVVMHFVYEESITAIAASSGAFAFIIGYSAQSTLGELFSGISINLSGSIKKGDHIEIGDVYGRVQDVDWRSVTVYQYTTGSHVVFPNSVLATASFRNFARPDEIGRNAHIITVEFTAPPDLVVRAIEEAFETSRIVLRFPAPYVHAYGMTDFGMQYRVMWYFANDDDWFPAQTEAYSAIWNGLRKYGMKPGLNHQFSGPGSQFDENQWSRRQAPSRDEGLAVMRANPLFTDLAEDVLEAMADARIERDFGPPEVIGRSGDAGGALMIVVRGRVALDLAYGDDESFTGLELATGECFGWAEAWTDTAHPVTVQCLEFATVYEFPATAIPHLGERLAALKTARLKIFESHRKAYSVVVARRQREAAKRQIVNSMSDRLSDAFKGGLLAWRHRGMRVQTMDAVMAATALVAAADGAIDDAEREEVHRTFTDLDLLRQLDEETGLARFEEFCDDIATDAGVERALCAVRRLAASPEIAALVLDICIAVSAADGEVDADEENRISEIREALGLAED